MIQQPEKKHHTVNRLLLVEFAAVDSFHRAVLFPFVMGYSKSAGITTRWLRFAVSASSSFQKDGVGLPASDAQKLSATVREFQPDLLLFSHTPSGEIIQAVRALQPAPRILDFSDRDAETEWLRGIQSSDPARRELRLMELATPDYGFEPANELARNLEPLPFVFVGEECSFDRSFSSNPFFKNLAISNCIRSGGCAFCTRPEYRGPWKTDPMEMLRRQLEAIAETLPLTGRGLYVPLVGEHVITDIETVAQVAARCPIDSLRLLIDCRADRFLESYAPVKRALESLESSDCRIEMSLMGVENFCSSELDRLNKGLSPATNIRAVRQLFELERAFPSNFGFRKHGGLSMISFTPWTTPTELVLNLMVVRLLGLEPVTGNLLTGRLRLYPGLPLAEAARRDALLVECYPDPLLDTARLNMYESELPWKFAQAEMGELNRVLLRLASDVRLPQDPAAQALDASGVSSRGVTSETVDAAVKLADRAMLESWSGSYPSAEALIGGTLASSPTTRRLPAAFEQWTRYQGLQSIKTEALLDLKPVIKLEPVSAEDRRHFENDPAFPNLRCRKRGVGDKRQEVFEVFFGRRREDVEEALGLAAQLETIDGREFTKALTRMGQLFGYPACCVEAFANARQWLQNNYFWLHVARRIENPAEAPCELNPAGSVLEYIPCSTDCAQSLERANRLLSLTATPKQEWLGRQRNPALIFWAVQSDSVELLPESQPGQRFKYRAGLVRGSNPLLDAVCRGDELVLEEECTTVLKQGRPLISLSGRAFLWWHQRAFQTEFWRALIEVLDVHAPREALRPQATPGPPPVKPTDFTRTLCGLLDRLKTDRSFGGLVLTKYTVTKEDRIRATLAGDDHRVELDIGPKRPGSPIFLEAGPFRLTYPMDCPITTEKQRKAAREFAAALAGLTSK